METREKFEALPKIKKIMEDTDVCYCETGMHYSGLGSLYATAGFMNGAWYAFQEQEKIINMQECGAKQIIEILNDFNSSEKPASFYSEIFRSF